MFKISVGVKIGNGKIECDDTALVGLNIVNNDDFITETDGPICVGIADGVGGNKGGKDASLFVMNELSKVDFESLSQEALIRVIQSINDRLLEFAKTNVGKETMATTLSAIWLGNEKSYLIHVGNTRAFMMRGSYLKQMTVDQTTYQWLINCGQNEAAENCNKNEILSCMGGNNPKLIEQLVVKEVFEDNVPQTILMTSDGIHEYVDIDSMEDIMSEEETDIDIIHKMIENAEINESNDDKTVLILRRV